MHIENIVEKEEKKLEKLWQMYQKLLDDYLQYTKEFYADYVDLKESDDAHQSQMQCYNSEMDKCVNELNELKLNVLKVQERHEIELKHLLDQKRNLSEKLEKLKNENCSKQSKETRKLRVMTSESYKQIKVISCLKICYNYCYNHIHVNLMECL